jgi:hypothetical protein
VHLVDFIIRIYHDARSHERQARIVPKIQQGTKTFRRFVLGAHLASRPVGGESKVVEKNWRYTPLFGVVLA